MELLLVGIGGALGSVSRYFISKLIAGYSNFVLATFIVNVAGAILLGVVSGIGFTGNLLLLCADGFLGSFTTFSTFMYEGFNLFQNKKKINAAIYIIGSMIIGVLGYFIGNSITL